MDCVECKSSFTSFSFCNIFFKFTAPKYHIHMRLIKNILSLKVALSALFVFNLFPSQAQTLDVLTKLRHEVQVSCQPSQAFFCGNMHVSCAGKTNVTTFPFTLQVRGREVQMMAPNHFEIFNQLYLGSQVEWGTDALYGVVTPVDSTGYIKIFQNGNYVFRYYPSKQQDGIMSLGKCE